MSYSQFQIRIGLDQPWVKQAKQAQRTGFSLFVINYEALELFCFRFISRYLILVFILNIFIHNLLIVNQNCQVSSKYWQRAHCHLLPILHAKRSVECMD